MEGRERYTVGEQIIHTSFGTGLVVEVRDRGFYDILEVAFQDGVKRLTSIHPDIVGRAGGATAATEIAVAEEVPAGGGDGDRAHAVERVTRRHDAGDGRRRPLPDWSGFENAVIELDPGCKRLLARLRRGKLDPHREARLRLKAEELAACLDPAELMAFDLARDVVRYPHQVEACRRVIGEMRGRALLADEVGLGKTIEAGVVLSEFIIRGLVRRALILVPASLQNQWREELRLKFGLRFHIRRRGEGFARAPFLITTLDTARVHRNQQQILEQSFDMVIIDEAHRLKNHRTLSYGFARALSARFLLLLTATPVHNDLRELYNLVTLLRPGTLGTYSEFRRRYVARGDRRIPKNTPELADHLSTVMIRTRREDTDIAFPRRIAGIDTIDPSRDEAELYSQVSHFVRGAYRNQAVQEAGGWHLALMTLQKEIGSSPRAAVQTLHKLARRCPEKALRSQALALAEHAQSLTRSAKLDGLLAAIESHDDKVLVFTQFLGTLRFLVAALETREIPVVAFHGSLTEAQREEVVRSFRRQARVMVSTDAGGEGRNLQFCHRMVNFDLPWNPMKIEQRIGRVHRLGQEHDVYVHSYSAAGTVESYVLNILHKKLRMFELVVGELDMILGQIAEATSIEDTVFKLWTLEDEREIEIGFHRLGDNLENARLRYEMIRDLDRTIFESIRKGVD